MDQTDDPTFPEAGHVNGSSMVGTTDSPGATEAAQPSRHADASGVRPGFLSELANAMRATAQRERETIAARVAEDAAAHVEKVKARAAVETEELRRLAEEDVQHIEEWSAAEMERIRAEAEQKVTDRRTSLDEYLQQHDKIIETEIEGVDAAVAEYGSNLDRFFVELADAGDPSAIVARAETLPAPPDLDQVRAQARAKAVAMFAEPETAAEPMTAFEASSVEAGAEAVAADADAPAPSTVEAAATPMEAMAGIEGSMGGDAAEASEFHLPNIDVDASNGDGTTEAVAEAVAETQPDVAAPVAEADVATAEPPSEPTPSAEPVPVMDPAATAEPGWPARETERPATISPSVDNTSAAVRLLRSVAPWTAPTHAGSSSETRSDPD